MLMQIPALSIVMRSGAMADVEYLGINKSGKIAMLKASDWVESKHPRADNGQFGSGGSSGSGSGQRRESQGAKHKRNQQARRAEQAAQTTLGGNKAIQSLLSGGSALDKIGWLNTSRPKEPEKRPEPKPKPESQADNFIRTQAEREKFITERSAQLLGNLRSGKITRDAAEKVKRELEHQSFALVREMRPMKDGDQLEAKRAEGKRIKDKIKAIETALDSHEREQPTKPIDWSKVRTNPGASSVRDDPLPRGYRVRSPEETAEYLRQHPSKKPAKDSYEEEYRARTGRDFDPTIA